MKGKSVSPALITTNSNKEYSSKKCKFLQLWEYPQNALFTNLWLTDQKVNIMALDHLHLSRSLKFAESVFHTDTFR